MRSRQRKHNSVMLIVFVILAAVYCFLMYIGQRITADPKVDGLIGVLYGLYTASHPAANGLDLLFYSRTEMRGEMTKRAYALWWGLNGLVLIAGWFAIVYGLIRFTSR